MTQSDPPFCFVFSDKKAKLGFLSTIWGHFFAAVLADVVVVVVVVVVVAIVVVVFQKKVF